MIKDLKKNQINLNQLNLEMTKKIINIKIKLLSNISHELRTPLNAILNLTDFISKETDNPEFRKNSKIIKYSSSNLSNSINNVLDYYKIDNNELNLNNSFFLLEKQLHKIQKNSKTQARQKN